MQTIRTSYAERFQDNQQDFDMPVEILDLDYAISPVREACAFQRRLDTRLTYSQLRAHVCLDWELGCVDAETTMQRLKDQSLFGNPDQFMTIFAAGVRALSEGAR
jgi:hypothetical protein